MLSLAQLSYSEKVNVSFLLPTIQNEQLLEVAQNENKDFTNLVIELLGSSLSSYFSERAFIQNSKYCQCCGKKLGKKKPNVIQVVNETFVIGNCCYDNDAYKPFILRFI